MTDEELIEAARLDGWEARWWWSRVQIYFRGFGRIVTYDTTTHICEHGVGTPKWMVAEPDEVLAKLRELKRDQS